MDDAIKMRGQNILLKNHKLEATWFPEYLYFVITRGNKKIEPSEEAWYIHELIVRAISKWSYELNLKEGKNSLFN